MHDLAFLSTDTNITAVNYISDIAEIHDGQGE